MSAQLEVRRVELLGDDSRWAWSFKRGVNVIVGPVGVGKTTLLNLVRFGLGGSWQPTKKARESAHSVRLHVRIETTDLTLTRSFGANTVVVNRDDIGERVMTVGSTRADRRRLSDELLELLGIPNVRVPSSRRVAGRAKAGAKMRSISFVDVLSYLYLEQEDIDRQTAKSEDKILNVKRQYIFELLYGLLDAQISRLQERARDLATEAQQLKNERVLAERWAERYQKAVSQVVSSDEVLARIRRLQQDVAAVTTRRESLTEVGAPTRSQHADLQRELTSIELELAQQNRELERFNDTLAQLDLDIESTQRAAEAVGHFQAFEYRVCPRCLQDLEADHGPENCRLCGQAEPDMPSEVAILTASARRSEQRAEADRLRADTAEAAATLELERKSRLDALASVEKAVIDHMSQVAELDQQRTQLLADLAVAKRELSLLGELPKPTEAVDVVSRRLTEVVETEETVAAEIEQHETSIVENRGRVADLSEIFREILTLFELPWFEGEAEIEPRDYLPRVDGLGLKALSSGGMKATVNLAYYLSNLIFAIRDPAVLTPRFMMIDGLRKDFGAGAEDLARARRIYRFLVTQQESMSGPVARRFQLIVVDNDLPTGVVDQVNVLKLDYDTPLISDDDGDAPGADLVRSGRGT